MSRYSSGGGYGRSHRGGAHHQQHNSSSSKLYAIEKFINKERDMKSRVKKMALASGFAAEHLKINAGVEASMRAAIESSSSRDPQSANNELEELDLFLEERRTRVKAMAEKHIRSLRNIEAHVEAARAVKADIEDRDQKATANGDGEDQGEDQSEEEEPNYEIMMDDKIEEIQRRQERNELDIQNEELMRKTCEKLGENVGNQNDDDELEIMDQPGGSTEHDFKCSITQQYFQEPVKNKVCSHVFEKAGIMQQLRTGKYSCPIPGCRNQRISLDQFEPDEEMIVKVRRFLAKKKRDEEKRKRRLTDLDDDDEEEEYDGNAATTIS